MAKTKVIGYCRVSTPKQDIKRQKRNILEKYPNAELVEETYTASTDYRPKFLKVMKRLNSGDTLVCDSVSRFSRNAEEGWKDYKELYDRGIDLVFLNEPYVNSEVFKTTMNSQIPMTGSDVDLILEGVNKYMMVLAEKQVKLAFEQAEKELLDIRERTRQGLLTARLNGKQIGRPGGRKYVTDKETRTKKMIRRDSKACGGTYRDKDLIELAHVTKSTYYKYKKEVLAELGLNR